MAAVQEYVKAQLLDLTLQSAAYPRRSLDALITPPNPGFLDRPTAFIWGGHMRESRRTFGRGYGFKKIKHDLRIYLVSIEDASDSTADTGFPSVIEAVLTKLRGVGVPTTIYDPTTNAQSQLLAIGEQFDVNFDALRTLQDQRLVRFLALITATVEESVLA